MNNGVILEMKLDALCCYNDIVGMVLLCAVSVGGGRHFNFVSFSFTLLRKVPSYNRYDLSHSRSVRTY